MVADGGDRVAISYNSPGKWRVAGWQVWRMRRGRQLVVDPGAHTATERGMKEFSMVRVSQEKKIRLAEAIAWADAKFGKREYVRNRMGDYVEREVNEKFPIRRNA